MLEQERKLVEEAKKNPEKFGILYDTYFDQIYRYVYRRVSNQDTANDLVSDTFYDALNNLKKYEWRGYAFSCWLYKIAHNNVLKWYRENSKFPTTELEKGKEIKDLSANQSQQLEEKETALEIEKVLKKLKVHEREIIRLKYFEELSNIEIAEITGFTTTNIGVRLFRALKKVKQFLATYE